MSKLSGIRTPAIYVPVRYQSQLERFPSAGPRANITGMRQKYWGENALIIRCGSYIYNVDWATYSRFAY